MLRTFFPVLLIACLALTNGCNSAGDSPASDNGDASTDSAPAARHSSNRTPRNMSPSGITDSALAAIDTFIADSNIDTSGDGWRTHLPRPPQVKFDEDTDYLWKLVTTEGDITVRIMADGAPMHASSLAFLTKLGFYDGLSFHRVIDGFMAQGGCPLGTGTGGPGYQYAGEFTHNARHDKPGILSMANAGPDTDGSQFFLTFVATPHLDGKHTVFGEVIEGLDTLKALEANGSRSGKPKSPTGITKATIELGGDNY